MTVDLDVPDGTILTLLPGEHYSPDGEPAAAGILLRVRAVSSDMHGGLVVAHGHTCNPHDPNCGSHHCWEGRVLVPAIRRNLADAR